MTLIREESDSSDIQSKRRRESVVIRQEIQLAILGTARTATYTTQPEAVLLVMSHD
jgi:hypothetical protein